MKGPKMSAPRSAHAGEAKLRELPSKDDSGSLASADDGFLKGEYEECQDNMMPSTPSVQTKCVGKGDAATNKTGARLEGLEETGAPDIATRADLERMDISSYRDRCPGQLLHLWVVLKDGKIVAEKYNPRRYRRRRGLHSIEPTSTELTPAPDSKIFLEVGIVIGAKPAKYCFQGSSTKEKNLERGSQELREKRDRGILPRDSSVRRAVFALDDFQVPKPTFYVAYPRVNDRSEVHTIEPHCIFFYKELFGKVMKEYPNDISEYTSTSSFSTRLRLIIYEVKLAASGARATMLSKSALGNGNEVVERDVASTELASLSAGDLSEQESVESVSLIKYNHKASVWIGRRFLQSAADFLDDATTSDKLISYARRDKKSFATITREFERDVGAPPEEKHLTLLATIFTMQHMESSHGFQAMLREGIKYADGELKVENPIEEEVEDLLV